MKKSLFFAAACVALASCSSDGYIGDVSEKSDGPITFSQSVPKVTRATTGGKDAAKTLNYNFIVYGFKNKTAETTTAANDEVVFDLYNINYSAGTENATLSNTHGWEYVGGTSKKSKAQTIKYWDYSALNYVFSAVSCGTGVTATKITDAATIAGTSLQDKGWQLSVPAGTTLDNLYASERKVMTKPTPSGTKYGVVNLTFYSLASRIRFAFYETVPGYSVKIDKFYYNSTSSTDKFGVDGRFKGMGTGTTNLIVTYDSSNHPVLSYNSESTSTYLELGTNVQSQTAIGETSNAATYDKAAGAYSLILPYESKNETESSLQTNILAIKLDYTLTSTDGSDETIEVKGATAYVPTEYTQWKNNYAYTYLFKISDNTSGSTGGDPSDPKGLYPITFDACVENVSDGTEETVTTVTAPSITTYQSGQVVTAQDGYKAGNIKVSVYDETDKEVTLNASNLKLYTAVSTDGTALTEKNVENYKNNGIILTDVSSALSFNSTDKTASFTAVADKAYIVEYTKSGTKTYKVVKVGTPAAANYTLKAYATGTTTPEITVINEGSSFDVKVFEGTDPTKFPVTGAAKNFDSDTNAAFTIAETSTPGTYTFTAKPGTSGAKTIKTKSGDTGAKINIQAFEFNPVAITIIGDDADTKTANLQLAGTDVQTGLTTSSFACTAGLSVTAVDGTTGTLTIKAAKTAETGTITYSNGGEVVATLDVTVQHYSFTPSSAIINCGSINDNGSGKSVSLKMQLGGADLTAQKTVTTTAAANVLVSNPSETDAGGEFTVKAGSVAGTATVAAPDGKTASIEVTNFKVSFFSDAACSTSAPATLVAGSTYYVKFTNSGTAENAAILVSAGTLTNTSTTGVYKWVTPASGETTIKYTYKTVQFTLFKQTF